MRGPNQKKNLKGLKPWEEHFICEYIRNGGNGRAAYQAARPSCKSSDSARTCAYQHLRMPHIIAGYNRLKEQMAEKLDMTHEQWRTELCFLAQVRPDKVDASTKLAALKTVGVLKGWIENDERQNNFSMLVLAQTEAMRSISPPKPPKMIDVASESLDIKRLAQEPLEED